MKNEETKVIDLRKHKINKMVDDLVKISKNDEDNNIHSRGC